LEATLELIQDLVMENVRSVRQASPLPLNQLKLLTLRHIQLIQEFQAIPRIVFSDEISSSYPQGRSAVYKIIRKILGQVADIIEQGQRMGQIKPALNPDAVSVIFLGLVQPPAILWYLSKGKFDVSKHMEKAWLIFEKAVRVETPKAVFFKKEAFKKPLKK